jgi:hypothetical protein
VRRFARWWLSLGGTATVVALLMPVAATDPDIVAREALTRRATDTLRTAGELARAVAASARADSGLQAHPEAGRAASPAAAPSALYDPRRA